MFTIAGAVLLAASLPAMAADCDPPALTLDRGESRRLILCHEGLVADPGLAVPDGIRIDYRQRLRHCGVHDNRPGLQLVVAAGDTATSGTLSVRVDTDEACRVTLTVPDRESLGKAELEPLRAGRFRLKTRLPERFAGGSGCELRLSFPGGDGLGLEADPEAGPLRCGRRMETTVRATNARPGPAKVVISGPAGVREAVLHAEAPPPEWTRAMAEEDARYVMVDGIRTRYFEAGRGEALILVHGGQPSSMDGTAWDWQQNFPGLAQHFHVYALDRVGQGYTDNPANLDDYQDYYRLVVRHLRGFMDALGIRRAHLVGHSQGSWPVTRIAVDEPERVASLILVDGTNAAPAREVVRSALRFYIYLTQDLHPKEGETFESARRGMAMFSYTGNNITDQRVRRLVEMTRQEKYRASQAWFTRSGMSPAHPSYRKLKEELVKELEGGALKVPVLIIWGQNDPEGSLPNGLELFRIVSASSPRARMHIFGKAGHVSFVEYPEEFNRVLTDFALGR